MSWESFLDDRTNHNLYVSALVHKPVIKLIRSIATPGDRLLEAGCGSGRTAMLFADMGYRTIALDLSLNLLARVSSAHAFLPDLDMTNADLGHLPFKDKIFTVAYSFGVLEHFDPPVIVPFLAEQRRVAKYVMVDIPNDRCTQQCYGDERFYSDSEFTDMLCAAGLEVERNFHRGLDRGEYVGNCSVFLAKDAADRDMIAQTTDVYDHY